MHPRVIVGNDAARLIVKGLAVGLASRVRVNVAALTWTETPLWRNNPRAEMQSTKAHSSKTISLGRHSGTEEVIRLIFF